MIERERQLTRSWEANAEAWANAVRGGKIESRRIATDAAILQAIRDLGPARVLDVGCGEGWLVRALAAERVEAAGIDASAPLIELARARGGGRFQVCSFAEVVADPGRVGAEYDVIVCNFALLEEDVAPLLRALRTRLAARGALLIQTLHPWTELTRGTYRNGWRAEDFAGLEGFVEPMPWFFRTLASWVDLLKESGYALDRLSEPVHPGSGEPLSLLLQAVRVD